MLEATNMDGELEVQKSLSSLVQQAERRHRLYDLDCLTAQHVPPRHRPRACYQMATKEPVQRGEQVSQISTVIVLSQCSPRRLRT